MNTNNYLIPGRFSPSRTGLDVFRVERFQAIRQTGAVYSLLLPQAYCKTAPDIGNISLNTNNCLSPGRFSPSRTGLDVFRVERFQAIRQTGAVYSLLLQHAYWKSAPDIGNIFLNTNNCLSPGRFSPNRAGLDVFRVK